MTSPMTAAITSIPTSTTRPTALPAIILMIPDTTLEIIPTAKDMVVVASNTAPCSTVCIAAPAILSAVIAKPDTVCRATVNNDFKAPKHCSANFFTPFHIFAAD